MEALQALPTWAQFFLALVVAGLLVLLNVGWLMQARGWLEAAKQKQRAGRAGSAASAGRTPDSAGADRAPSSVTARRGDR